MLYEAKILRASSDIRVLEKQVADGVTDGNGRTGILYLDRKEIEPYSLIEKVGAGAGTYGASFLFRSASGSVVRDWYEIRGCPDSTPYRGFSDKRGETVYLTSERRCEVTIRIGHQYSPHPEDNSKPAGPPPVVYQQ